MDALWSCEDIVCPAVKPGADGLIHGTTRYGKRKARHEERIAERQVYIERCLRCPFTECSGKEHKCWWRMGRPPEKNQRKKLRDEEES